MRQAILGLLLALMMLAPVRAEDGHELWLRHRLLAPAVQAQVTALTGVAGGLHVSGTDPVMLAARAEAEQALAAMTGRAPKPAQEPEARLLITTLSASPKARALGVGVERLGPEGFTIGWSGTGARQTLVVAGATPRGALYGTYELLRRLSQGESPDRITVTSVPTVQLRVLNHWDNLDRTVERGYAGQSIFDWHRLPDHLPRRYVDYARANASIGINGVVLNNVNSNARILTPYYLTRVAALAEVFRPYGIRVYLSARFSAPMEIGGLPTADPLDPAVRAWWAAKAAEIYRTVPDFGGFLVKANSEGQPGPQDYGRSHADGANMLADALAPHGGTVMWRAFVYANETPVDRIMQAYNEFAPLDGAFRPNVLVQVKNGPLDFQPREPFHPLFGAMPKTPLMLEVQITKEYLGFSTHIAWLGKLWEEVLRADTLRAGPGSTVAKVVDGSLHGHRLTGMAGVANIGVDRTWAGSHFDQANWYAFGRMAWNPQAASADDIAREWSRQTFGRDETVTATVLAMLNRSREAVVDYMAPLGLHHLMARGHHYGPGPWVEGGPRADWTAVYFHRADRDGIGVDRTRRGSVAVDQYAPPLAERFGAVETTPEQLLLWFHRLAWDHPMASGRSLWAELVARYDRGVAATRQMQADWQQLSGKIDAERHRDAATFLRIQTREAQWWRDASIAYFQYISGRALPPGTAPPPESLEHYKSLDHPYAPGHH